MWKKCLTRGAVSYCVSATVTLLGGLIAVLCGAPQVVTSEFAGKAGGALTATLLQPLLIGLIGFAFGAGSVLFEIEKWSFLKQGAAHLALTAAVWLAVELICFTPFSAPVIISFAASIAGTYAVTWGMRYLLWREQVRRINEQIHRKNGGQP